MKNKNGIKTRILSLLLVLALMIATAVSVTAVGTNDEPMIVVSEATGKPGSTVSVTVGLENNPGIVSMTLRMSYDDEILTFEEVKDAGILGATSHKPELVNPHTLVWVNDTATTNYTVNGTIVTLVFTVSSTAESGTVVPIEITYNYDNYDIYDKDATRIKFGIDNGHVKVEDTTLEEECVHSGGTATCVSVAICDLCEEEYGNVDPNNHVNTEVRDALEATYTDNGYTGDTYCNDCGEKLKNGRLIPRLSESGDVNDDKSINLLDVTAVLKHIAKWNIEINLDAADVNDDTKIDLADPVLILKFIAGWDVVLK